VPTAFLLAATAFLGGAAPGWGPWDGGYDPYGSCSPDFGCCQASYYGPDSNYYAQPYQGPYTIAPWCGPTYGAGYNYGGGCSQPACHRECLLQRLHARHHKHNEPDCAPAPCYGGYCDACYAPTYAEPPCHKEHHCCLERLHARLHKHQEPDCLPMPCCDACYTDCCPESPCHKEHPCLERLRAHLHKHREADCAPPCWSAAADCCGCGGWAGPPPWGTGGWAPVAAASQASGVWCPDTDCSCHRAHLLHQHCHRWQHKHESHKPCFNPALGPWECGYACTEDCYGGPPLADEKKK
jgi:hypothetical protein